MCFEKFYFDLKDYICDLVDSVKQAKDFLKSLKDKNSPICELPLYNEEFARIDGFYTVLVRLTDFIYNYKKGVIDES